MNRRTTETPATETGPVAPAKTNLAAWAFWGTLVFLAIATVGVALIGNMRAGDTGQTNEVEIDFTAVERAVGTSSEVAFRVVQENIDPPRSDADESQSDADESQIDTYRSLSNVYDPVYAAIPGYLDFHYSVRGEYSELVTVFAKEQMGARLQEQLFNGFDQRINSLMEFLDEKYMVAYVSAFDAEIQNAIAADNPHGVLSEATQLVLDDAVARARVTFPVAGAAAIAGSGGLKALTGGIAAKLTAKIAPKLAAKGGLKAAGFLAGAGGGGALCAWGGPLAVACGVIGGIGTWLLVDAAIVNLDEFFNREEFEAELRDLVDQHKADTRQRVLQAFESKGVDMDKAINEDFRLSELAKAAAEN